MAVKVLYFGSDPASPFAVAARKRSAIKCVGPNDDVSADIAEADAAIVDCRDEERANVLKMLLKEKKQFTLVGLAGETPDSLKRLCAAAKRRHIQICWMGSYRFEWAMAKMRETVVSGCLGAINQVRLVKKPAVGIFERLRDSDLLNGLLAGHDVAYSYDEGLDDDLKVIIGGSCGIATATIHPDGMNDFTLNLVKGRQHQESHSSDPANGEIGYLLYAIEHGEHWSLLGRIPN